MTAVTQARLQMAVFEAACKICELKTVQITHPNLSSLYAKAGLALLEKQGLIQLKHATSVPIRRGEEEIEAEVIRIDDKRLGVWDGHKNVVIDPTSIKNYRLDFEWLIRWVASALNIKPPKTPKELLAGRAWEVGTTKSGRQEIRILFARRLHEAATLNSLRELIEASNAGSAIAILTTSDIPKSPNLPADVKLFSLSDLAADAVYLKLDRSKIIAAFQASSSQDGYSADYRTVTFEGQTYKFAKKQAAIIKKLRQAKRPIHKDMLMENISEQTEPKGLFRRKGGYHPAWGKLILFDGEGNYWLKS